MMFDQFVSFYLSLNCTVAIGFLVMKFLIMITDRSQYRLKPSDELQLHCWILVLSILLTIVSQFDFTEAQFVPFEKSFHAEAMNARDELKVIANDALPEHLSLQIQTVLPAQADFRASFNWLVLMIVILGFFRFTRDVLRLTKFSGTALACKKIGRVHLLKSDLAASPFSFWLPGSAYVVMPAELFSRRLDWQMALSHELQHHRQQDTKWIYLLRGIQLLCPLNPAILKWNEWISEIQEFACDQAVLGRHKFDLKSYAECLVEAAQNQLAQTERLACANGFFFQGKSNTLRRRIESMLTPSSKTMNRPTSVIIAGLVASITVVLGLMANAAVNLAHTSSVSLAEAKLMAEKITSESEFAIEVNDLVLTQLNQYLGTKEGRESLQAVLERLRAQKDVLSRTLRKYSAPEELLAIPIVESGYQNLPQKKGKNANPSAGVWQFIPRTARIYGLKVDARTDERLDLTQSTDAAVRYLQANQLRFKNWQLSILAYNMGENAVQAAIEKTGSRDPWTLIRKGHEGDKNYLAKVMAAVLILKNPELLQKSF